MHPHAHTGSLPPEQAGHSPALGQPGGQAMLLSIQNLQVAFRLG